MDGQLPAPGQAAGDFTREAIAGLRALSAGDHEPLLLAYHPIARLNPFHGLLYQRGWESGIAAVRIIRDETFPELIELSRLGFATALHLHWLNLVLKDAASAKEARKHRARFVDLLDRYRDAGGRIVWTVHNILPHAARFEEEEAHLSEDVIARSDVVHIMTAATPRIVSPWYRIPAEKILEIPHPSYLGAYEDLVSRAQARHVLGLAPDDIVHVVLGAIRPYKGLTELLDAWDELVADGRPHRLVIAGGPTEEPGVAEVLERAAIHPSVLLHAGPVEPADVQIYLRAADIAVLPYVRALNSGALLLALTFGLPCIVPDGGGLAQVVRPEFSKTFTLDDPAALGAALRGADALLTPAASLAARATAERLAPGPISERFARELRVRLGLVAAPSSGSDDVPAPARG